MPLYFRVPLPGPFSYSKRIGGRRKKGPPNPIGALLGLILAVAFVVALVVALFQAPTSGGFVVLGFVVVVVLTVVAKAVAARGARPRVAAPRPEILINGRTLAEHEQWVSEQSPTYREVYARELARIRAANPKP